MGWMIVGMGFCSAPGSALTAEATKFAEDFLFLDFEPFSLDAATSDAAAVSLAWTTLRAACLGPCFLFSSAPSALSAATAFFFLDPLARLRPPATRPSPSPAMPADC